MRAGLIPYRATLTRPFLILMDFQKEYCTEGRLPAIGMIDLALSRARKVLTEARAMKLPIAHLRYERRGNFFTRNSPFSEWIEGFEPRPSERIFVHDSPSAYSSPEFANVMEAGGGENAVLLGFSGNISCLATIIDAYHKAHALTYISDASASHSLFNSHTDEDAHDAAILCAQPFCDVKLSETVLSDLTGVA